MNPIHKRSYYTTCNWWEWKVLLFLDIKQVYIFWVSWKIVSLWVVFNSFKYDKFYTKYNSKQQYRFDHRYLRNCSKLLIHFLCFHILLSQQIICLIFFSFGIHVVQNIQIDVQNYRRINKHCCDVLISLDFQYTIWKESVSHLCCNFSFPGKFELVFLLSVSLFCCVTIIEKEYCNNAEP